MRPGSQHAQRASEMRAKLLALLAIVLAALLAIKKMRPIIGKPARCWLYCHLFVSL
jgi:flagellar biogenesis protein FliO